MTREDLELFSGCHHSSITAEVFRLQNRPRCDNSGNFSPVQCAEGSGCYCVDPNTGQERSGTRVALGITPNCLGKTVVRKFWKICLLTVFEVSSPADFSTRYYKLQPSRPSQLAKTTVDIKKINIPIFLAKQSEWRMQSKFFYDFWFYDRVCGRYWFWIISIISVTRYEIQFSAPLRNCPSLPCTRLCPYGYEMNPQGCPECRCRNPCRQINCLRGFEICLMVDVQCFNQASCPQQPRCEYCICHVSGKNVLNALDFTKQETEFKRKFRFQKPIFPNNSTRFSTSWLSGVPNACPLGRPFASEDGIIQPCGGGQTCPRGFWCHNFGIAGRGICCGGTGMRKILITFVMLYLMRFHTVAKIGAHSLYNIRKIFTYSKTWDIL